MKKLFLALPFVCLITACGDPSVDDLIEDPELFGKVFQECIVKSAQGKEDDSEKCKSAAEAQKKMAKAIYNNAMKSLKKPKKMEATDESSSKLSESNPVDKASLNITGMNYVSKPDPNFKPEYASTMKLFFESDEKVKLSFRYYDTGKFRENEDILSYKIDGDIITLATKNGGSVILTIRGDGSLFNDVDKTEFIKLD